MPRYPDDLYELLLVEDEPADAHLVRVAVDEGRIPCRLHHVSDGVEALEFLRRQVNGYRQAPRPDLILLDLNMPRMNGREFLSEIKKDQSLASIPVVVLTTSEVERDINASFQLGASGYITKPMDMNQFVAAINRLGDYWFSLSRLPR